MIKRNIGIVFFSNTIEKEFYDMTKVAIATFIDSCKNNNIKFQIVLVETQNLKHLQKNNFNYNYENFHLITNEMNESFGYNKFLNYGFKYLLENFNLNYYCIMNNDIIFNNTSIIEIVKSFEINLDIMSMSPLSIDYSNHYQYINKGLVEGYSIAHEFAGWSLFFREKTLKYLYPFDEQFIMWFQDDDIIMNLKQIGYKHFINPNATIKHLFSKSHSTFPKDEYYNYTEGSRIKFINKWRK